ncbi:hypothetical protein H6P81_016550 [Aristolochia fimbriata]|uniref:UspA domain-containing protein n=1 Tax=Aristolochia fimbriata TaxID=158543 RepID=A0AAV7EAR0_ARIFI|nr:hypothetical protein H6P81_016550 [Aristolochia fimbriata]
MDEASTRLPTSEASPPTPGICTRGGGGGGGDTGKKPMKVMVAIDDTEVSLYALRWAVDHLFDADADAGASETRLPGDVAVGAKGSILIVNVVEPYSNPVYAADALSVPPTEVAKAVTKENAESSSRLIARAVEICSGSSATVETMVVEGKPNEAICEIAEKIHPDLVVVGSRGLGQIKRALMGSVSDYCTHNLNCPVLVVKPPK